MFIGDKCISFVVQKPWKNNVAIKLISVFNGGRGLEARAPLKMEGGAFLATKDGVGWL